MQYGIVLVTAPTREEAIAIAQALIDAKLAACVSLLPVHSIYTWQGNLEQSDEWQLLIKSDLERFAEIAEQVRSIHSYEVPEIIALPIQAGSPPYLAWIAEQVQRPPEP